MAYQGNNPTLWQNKKLDTLTFNGSTTTFALTSNGSPVYPARPEAVIFSINGVIQEPVTSFTISGSNITFSSAPPNGAANFGVMLGQKVLLADVLAASGGSMTGFLSLVGAPTSALHAATKSYVDSSVAAVSSGGTLTGTTLVSPVITDNIQIITANTNAVRGITYVLNADAITLTLPASPAVNDVLYVINRAFSACVIARNGSNIMGLAENMTVDSQYVPFALVYANSTIGWMIK